MANNRIAYTVHLTTWDGATNTRELLVTLGYMAEPNQLLRSDNTLRLRWLQSKEHGVGRYFAFHASMECQDFEGIKTVTSLARRIEKKGVQIKQANNPSAAFYNSTAFDWYYSPGLFALTLEALNATQYVYDPRLSRYIPLSELLPREYTVWHDDLGSYRFVSVLARDEDEARKLIRKEMVARLDEDHPSYLAPEPDHIYTWLQDQRIIQLEGSSYSYPHWGTETLEQILIDTIDLDDENTSPWSRDYVRSRLPQLEDTPPLKLSDLVDPDAAE